MSLSATAELAQPIRVLVVDDHEAVRTGLERVLQRSSDFTLVSALADHRRLFGLLRRERIDAVILDYDLDRTDGLSLCLRIKQTPTPPAVVIYSGYAAPPIVLAATVAQADAVVHKAEPVSTLLDALRRLARGHRLLGPPAPELLEAVAARLDERDLPVMALLVQRASAPEIARALGLDEEEVRRRTRRIIGILQAGRTRGSPLRVS